MVQTQVDRKGYTNWVEGKCPYCDYKNEEVFFSPKSGFMTGICGSCFKTFFIDNEEHFIKIEDIGLIDVRENFSSDFMDDWTADNIDDICADIYDEIKNKAKGRTNN